MKRFVFALGLITVAMAANAQSLINLELRPTVQNILVGQTATVELWAVASTPTAVELASMDVNITWNSSVVNPINSTTSGGAVGDWTLQGFLAGPAVNSSLSDGDARWTAISNFFNIVSVPSSGIKLINFTFTGVALGTTQVSMPATLTGSTPTDVFQPTTGNSILGTIGPSVTINVVPEPATMTALGLGLAAMLRSRKRA